MTSDRFGKLLAWGNGVSFAYAFSVAWEFMRNGEQEPAFVTALVGCLIAVVGCSIVMKK